MKTFLSERAQGTEKSAIREILKLIQSPDIISFAGGLPKPETFPREALADAAHKQISQNYEQSLQYGTTEGVTEFREEMIKWLENFGYEIELENIIATNSSQQALDLVSKTFLDPGDNIFVGSPTYLGAVQSFSLFQANSIGVPLESDGMNLDVLEEKIRAAESGDAESKFIYVIPDFQNPMGVTLSEKKRKRLVEIADTYDLLIIEDTPYFGLRFKGKPIRPIGSYDESGRVISVSSMSKVLSSGMRLAIVVGSVEMIDSLITVKQATDLCTSTTTQWIAAEWLKNNNMTEHLDEISGHYKKNRNVMLEAMEKFFPDDDRISWTEPEGGLFIWVRLPQEIDTEELFHEAISEKVAFVPGKGFYVDGGGKSTLRLSFSLPSPEDIESGIKRLGRVIEKNIAPVTNG